MGWTFEGFRHIVGWRQWQFMLDRSGTEDSSKGRKRRGAFGGVWTAKYTFNDIIGESSEMKRLKIIASKVSQTSATILITGESGTGKELFAHSIHQASSGKTDLLCGLSVPPYQGTFTV